MVIHTMVGLNLLQVTAEHTAVSYRMPKCRSGNLAPIQYRLVLAERYLGSKCLPQGCKAGQVTRDTAKNFDPIVALRHLHSDAGSF